MDYILGYMFEVIIVHLSKQAAIEYRIVQESTKSIAISLKYSLSELLSYNFYLLIQIHMYQNVRMLNRSLCQ